jgi:hypothetical protein
LEIGVGLFFLKNQFIGLMMRMDLKLEVSIVFELVFGSVGFEAVSEEEGIIDLSLFEFAELLNEDFGWTQLISHLK